MTQEEKNIIIEEAQKIVDIYYETPVRYFDVRNEYSARFMTLQLLYARLTDRFLVVVKETDTYKVQEQSRP